MRNLNRQLKTVFVNPKAIAKSGLRMAELKPFTIALFDMKTQRTIDVGEYCPDTRYKILFKSSSKGAANAMFPDQRGAQLPLDSYPIDRIDKAHSFNEATSEGKRFVGYLGWDGISDCKTLNFECAQDYGLQITVRGRTVRDVFGRNMTEIVPFNTGCCDDCNLDEACDKTLDTIIKAIETSSFYVKNYFKVNKVKSCCPAEAPFDKKLYKKFKLTVCDNGDSAALADVQIQYPEYDIECVDRKGPNTTYEICVPCPYLSADETAIDAATVALTTAQEAMPLVQADVDAAQVALDAAILTASTNAEAACMPEDFIMKNTAIQVCDECPDCPNTFTKIEGGDKVIACFNTAAAAGVTTLEEFNTEYYADQLTAQATIDALVETTGALVPGYTANSAKVLGVDCDKVTLQVCVTTDTALTEHGVSELTLTKIGVCKGFCEGESTFPWCPGDEAYKISRKQCLLVKHDDCDNPVSLEEILESLGGREDVLEDSVVIEKVGTCSTRYTLEQCNNECLEDGCDTYGVDGAKFDRLPSYEGILWKECECEGWTFDSTGCPVAPVEDLNSCLCGIKFEGAHINNETMECVWDITDQVNTEPITIEISLIRQYDDNEMFCDPLKVDWTVVQHGTIAQGLGQFVAREEIQSREYDLYNYVSPKEALGSLWQQRLGYEYNFDPNEIYNHISLYHNYSRLGQSWHSAAHGTNREIIKIFVPAHNVAFMDELKAFFNATLLDNGVCELL